MLEALKFVMRGVARRDYIPGLTHFHIKDKRCTGYNGTLTLSAPVDIGFNVAPQASIFIKALNACEDVISLKMQDETTLHVRSGPFQISIPCVPLESVPVIVPAGKVLAPNRSILGAFEALEPFIGVDASRPWCMGILLTGQSAYATNNIIVAEYWLDSDFPAVVNIPSVAIEEVLRIHEEMVAIQVDSSSITFHYSDGRWVKSPVLALDWPNIPALMIRCWTDAPFPQVPDGLQRACEILTAFGEKDLTHIYFRGDNISTHRDGALGGGAVFALPNLPARGCYYAKHLNTVLASAEAIGFDKYPNAVPFYGGNIRGIMLGAVT